MFNNEKNILILLLETMLLFYPYFHFKNGTIDKTMCLKHNSFLLTSALTVCFIFPRLFSVITTYYNYFSTLYK